MTDKKPFNIWNGVYGSFAEAVSEMRADATAFEEDVWMGKIVDRAARLKAAAQSSAIISPVTETRDYALPFVAATLAQEEQALRILDFGGGMGTSFVPLTAMLPQMAKLDFVVVENPTICAKGREIFAGDAGITFSSDLPGAGVRFDIVHSGSSLQYVEDWKGMLRTFAGYQPQFLVFSDIPASDNPSFVTAQSYYGKYIPMHFWNVGELIAGVEALGYETVLRSQYRGYWRDGFPDLPTDNLPLSVRPTYFSQLVFRRGAKA